MKAKREANGAEQKETRWFLEWLKREPKEDDLAGLDVWLDEGRAKGVESILRDNSREENEAFIDVLETIRDGSRVTVRRQGDTTHVLVEGHKEAVHVAS